MEEDNETLVQKSADKIAKKRRITMLLFAYSAVFGIIVCFLPEEDIAIDFFVGLPFQILGIAWCFVDASERDHRISRLTYPIHEG